MIQYHLSAPGASGKAVRVRRLSSHEAMEVSRSAAKLAGKDATALDYRMAELDEGIRKFVCAVSKEAVKPGDLVNDDSRWEKLTPEKLLDAGVDAYLNAKDVDILRKVYSQLHEVKFDELEDILGKAVEVSEG